MKPDNRPTPLEHELRVVLGGLRYHLDEGNTDEVDSLLDEAEGLAEALARKAGLDELGNPAEKGRK